MDKGYKMIRIITVAPVLAIIMMVIVAGSCEDVFPSPWHLAYSMLFLGVLPLLAYPLQKYIPVYKDKGREGQRNLAIILAAAAGMVLAVLVFVASMETKRHTFFQLLGGGMVPLISIIIIGSFLT